MVWGNFYAVSTRDKIHKQEVFSLRIPSSKAIIGFRYYWNDLF